MDGAAREEEQRLRWEVWRALAPVYLYRRKRITSGEALLILCRAQGFDPWIADMWLRIFSSPKTCPMHVLRGHISEEALAFLEDPGMACPIAGTVYAGLREVGSVPLR